eukprot:5994220-Pyramimonas_sp.AAC.1
MITYLHAASSDITVVRKDRPYLFYAAQVDTPGHDIRGSFKQSPYAEKGTALQPSSSSVRCSGKSQAKAPVWNGTVFHP